jgi:multiple sugar transport system substrate-binding protein
MISEVKIMPTMKDVANLAAVSVATVSNFLNGTKSVKPDTRRKIQEAIERLNFHPNLSARNLKTNSSSEIGVILPNTLDSYYSYVLQGVEKVFQDSIYNLNIAFSNDIPERELNLLNKLLRKNIKGLIIFTCQPERLNYFRENFMVQNIPVVFLERNVAGLETNFICFDNRKTICHLTTKLLADGFDKIGLIIGPGEFFSESECLAGFKQAFLHHETGFDPQWISFTNFSKEDAFRSAISMLQNYGLKAVVASSESIAKGVLEAAQIRGIEIPEELLILSLGQECWNSYSSSLGTMVTRRPALNMGEEAARLLQKNISSPILFEKQRIVLEDKILEQDLDFNRRRKPARSNIHKGSLKVLMLESPSTLSFKGLLPHFTNQAGVEVEIKTWPQPYILNRIVSNAEQGEDDIDVYMFDIPWLPYLAANKYLMNLAGLMENADFNKDIFIPGCLKYFGEFQGGYYGLPFLYGPQLLFYRKDLFHDPLLKKEFEKRYQTQLRPPRTWLEFNAVAEFFTKTANPDSPVEYGTGIAAGFPEIIVPEFLPRFWAYKGQIFNHENRVVLNSPESVKALTNFGNTFKYTHPDTLHFDIEKTVADFYEGNTAMLICYVSYTTDINNRFKSKIVGKIGYDLIPGRAPVMAGWSLGIGPNCKNPALAFEFINWACGSDICNHYTILDGQSTLVDVYKNDELLKLYPWLSLVLESFKYCRPRRGPYAPEGRIIPQNDLELIVAKAIYGVVKNKLPVEEALAKAQIEMESLFEEYGYR